MSNEPEFLPEEWLIELGKLMQSWATLDHFLNMMIEKLCSFSKGPYDPKFTILIAHSSLPQRLDIFSALCDGLTEEFPHLGSYREVTKHINFVSKERNFFAHNMVSFDEFEKVAYATVISARGRLKMERQRVDLERVTGARLAAFKATKSLYALVLRNDPWSE